MATEYVKNILKWRKIEESATKRLVEAYQEQADYIRDNGLESAFSNEEINNKIKEAEKMYDLFSLMGDDDV